MRESRIYCIWKSIFVKFLYSFFYHKIRDCISLVLGKYCNLQFSDILYVSIFLLSSYAVFHGSCSCRRSTSRTYFTHSISWSNCDSLMRDSSCLSEQSKSESKGEIYHSEKTDSCTDSKSKIQTRTFGYSDQIPREKDWSSSKGLIR